MIDRFISGIDSISLLRDCMVENWCGKAGVLMSWWRLWLKKPQSDHVHQIH